MEIRKNIELKGKEKRLINSYFGNMAKAVNIISKNEALNRNDIENHEETINTLLNKINELEEKIAKLENNKTKKTTKSKKEDKGE